MAGARNQPCGGGRLVGVHEAVRLVARVRPFVLLRVAAGDGRVVDGLLGPAAAARGARRWRRRGRVVELELVLGLVDDAFLSFFWLGTRRRRAKDARAGGVFHLARRSFLPLGLGQRRPAWNTVDGVASMASRRWRRVDMKCSRDAEPDSSTGGGLVGAFLGFGGAFLGAAAFFTGFGFGADSNSSSLSSSREKSSSPARVP